MYENQSSSSKNASAHTSMPLIVTFTSAMSLSLISTRLIGLRFILREAVISNLSSSFPSSYSIYVKLKEVESFLSSVILKVVEPSMVASSSDPSFTSILNF